jgi:hypothetical protein
MKRFLIPMSLIVLFACEKAENKPEIPQRDNIYILDSVRTSEQYDFNKDGIVENILKEIPQLKESLVEIKDIDDISYINILWTEPVINNTVLMYPIEKAFEMNYDISAYKVVQNQFYGYFLYKGVESTMSLTKRISGNEGLYTYKNPTNISFDNNEQNIIISSKQKFLVNKKIVSPTVISYYTIKKR